MTSQIAAFLMIALLAASAAAGEAPNDEAKRLKDYAPLRQTRFYRTGATMLDQAVRFARIEEGRITPSDRFLRAFYEGRWDEVRTTLAALPADMPDAVYDKMLDDLTGQQVPVMTLDDFLGLADACPTAFDAARIRKLGLLLRAAVPKEQAVWLKRALEKGMLRLGGAEEQRLATGRILLQADFGDLARQYLPNIAEAARIEEAEVRDEIVKFLTSREELEELQQGQIAAIWKEKADLLGGTKGDWSAKQRAAEQLTELIARAPLSAVEPWLRILMRDDPDGGLRLASVLGKSVSAKLNSPDVAARAAILKAQKSLLTAAATQTKLTEPPWSAAAEAMTDGWLREAELCLQTSPVFQTGRPPAHFVGPEDLLDAAPSGVWAEALPPSLRERIDTCLSRIVLVSDRYEEAAEMIVALAGRNPEAGAKLAEDYLKTWALRHDPQIPAEIRKKYKLAEDARIVVTPMMMEQNIDSLARIMELFRRRGIPLANAKLLADAFVVCYGSTEVYRQSHIERVFGPVETMDEEIFHQMIRAMGEGLASRWRKIELQKESGTRRSREETLEMVRGGYAAAVEMIERRAAKQPDAWRILATAGTLLSDWGDFEYYQELSAETAAGRAERFREKNNAAERYFTRAVQAYVRQVPALDESQWSIDAFTAWFHALLGIGANGDLNLSKPLDRRSLDAMRTLIRGLPERAARVHIDRFARFVAARMDDPRQPLHEELKYRYLAASLVLTRDSPFSLQAANKVNYYDELLKEIRLETRVDGSSTVERDRPFGILLCVRHTEAMGRMADFGKYLVNRAAAGAPQPAGGAVRKMGESKGFRDDLELNLRDALSMFFDVVSVTFSPRDVQPRPTDRPGWQETVLAYVLAKAKDSSVDRIPRIQMNLEFLDLTGPVTIPAESAETMIHVTDRKQPPRPFARIDLTVVLDARNLATTQEALLEIAARANGLVPELEELVDGDALAKQLPIARIDPHDGLFVREINSWADAVHPVSERRWTVALDASALADPPRRMMLQLPKLKTSVDASVRYQAYRDMDLADLAEPSAPVGFAGGADAVLPTGTSRWGLAGAGAGVASVLIAVVAIGLKSRRRGLRTEAAREAYRLPERLDGFVVIELLRSIGTNGSIRLSEAQRGEMQREIERIERSCFGGDGAGLAEEDLSNVAKKWLKIAR